MIAVSDSGPIHYLVLIDCVTILADLFERVLIPQAVYDELRHDQTPQSVYAFISLPPDWLEVAPVESSIPVKGLGKGEWEAITLAESHQQNTVLLMDDSDGRSYAEERGLDVVGTLGLLVRASRLKKVNLREAVERLLQTNFRVHPRLIRSLLRDE